jgi:DNA-binding NarL/FixJ family response regulator
VSIPSWRRRVYVVDPIGDVYAAIVRCQLGVHLRRFSADESLADESCELVVYACYGTIDWGAISRSSARVPTVVVTSPATDSVAYQLLDAGAFGFIDAGLAPDAFGRALAGALHGEPAFPRRVFADLLRRRIHAATGMKTLPLTGRQREVAELIASGAADKEIANVLGIATTTAQKHVTHLLRRLDVPNRAAAAAIIAASAKA